MSRGNNQLFKAIEFAARFHAGQWRKGTSVPYLVHPFNVMKILIQAGCGDDVIIAGILHDTVEDTSATIEEIEHEFSKNIARLVAAVSSSDKKQLWEKRKGYVLDMIKSASEDIVLIELADKLDNIRSMREDIQRQGESVWEKFKRGKEKQQWYYESLVMAFEDRARKEPLAGLFREFKNCVQEVFSN